MMFFEMILPYILGIAVLIQIFYYLYFFLRLATYSAKERTSSQEYPLSVIICARDEAANLAKNLPGILVQDYSTTHELIVVNDNSVDESKFILKEFAQTFKNLTILPLSQEAIGIPGKKFPLSMGIRSARHEIVLLTDADCIPASEHWMQKMQSAYMPETEVVLGYGAYHKKPGLLNKLIRFETFHSALQYFSYALAGSPYMGVGRNLSYRKELFLRNKGFSAINHIPSGDDDLFINMVANKHNTAIMINKEAHTLSEPPLTWRRWMNQKNRHYTTAKYYKPLHKFLLGMYSLLHVIIYPLAIATAIFSNWIVAVSIFGARLLIEAFIWFKTMKKLNEADLFPLFIFFDIWIFVYNLMFFPSLFKRPSKKWN